VSISCESSQLGYQIITVVSSPSSIVVVKLHYFSYITKSHREPIFHLPLSNYIRSHLYRSQQQLLVIAS